MTQYSAMILKKHAAKNLELFHKQEGKEKKNEREV